MPSANEPDRPVPRAAQRRPLPPIDKAAITSLIEFFDAEEGQVWLIHRADGTAEVQVAADLSQPR